MAGVDDSLMIGVKELLVRAIAARKYTKSSADDKSDGMGAIRKSGKKTCGGEPKDYPPPPAHGPIALRFFDHVA
jgi:hypothetical protein